ncbi:MAG: hypothetical protein R3A51_18040 [Nannocystaceae bacterium]|nr:hypothetical protein [Myxococcales bacterium]
MEEHNPFAPPSATADRPEGTALVFSPEGARIVSSLATWMRTLSIIYYIGLALMLVATCGAVATASSAGMGGAGFIAAIAMLVVVVLIGMAATWLRSAGTDFERGVFSDDEFPIGQGFRSLRAYLIMFGIIGILGLLSNIKTALEVM